MRSQGQCSRKYWGSNGLMPQDLKPDRIFRGVTASTYASVHSCTKSAGDGVLWWFFLFQGSSFLRNQAFTALKTALSSGWMTSVRMGGNTTTSTPPDFIFYRPCSVRCVLLPSTNNKMHF